MLRNEEKYKKFLQCSSFWENSNNWQGTTVMPITEVYIIPLPVSARVTLKLTQIKPRKWKLKPICWPLTKQLALSFLYLIPFFVSTDYKNEAHKVQQETQLLLRGWRNRANFPQDNLVSDVALPMAYFIRRTFASGLVCKRLEVRKERDRRHTGWFRNLN